MVLAGFIDDQTLADFYRTRLMVPQVTPRQLARVSQELLAKIPADMATEFRCMPVALDRDQNLTVAMADPSTTHTVDEIAFFTGHYVVRAVATQSQIAWCLAHYYGMLTPLGRKLMRNPAGASIPGPMPPLSALTRVDAGAPVLDEDLAHGHASRESGPKVLPRLGLAAPRLVSPTASVAQPNGPSRLPLQPPEPMDRHSNSSPVPVAIEPDPVPLRPPPMLPPPSQNARVVSFLQEDTAPTGPIRTLRTPEANPPELAARAGELHVPTGPVPTLGEDLPAVMISLRRDSEPAFVTDLPEHRPLPLPEPVELMPLPEPAPGATGEAAVATEPEALARIEHSDAQPGAQQGPAPEVPAPDEQPDIQGGPANQALLRDQEEAPAPEALARDEQPPAQPEVQPPVQPEAQPPVQPEAQQGPANQALALEEQDDEPRAARPERGPSDSDVVLLHQPRNKREQPRGKAQRKKWGKTQIGLGFGEPRDGAQPGASSDAVPAELDADSDLTVPSGPPASLAGMDGHAAAEHDATPRSLFAAASQAPDGAPLMPIAVDESTGQMAAPTPYPGDWPRLEPRDSIQRAAEAAAQALGRLPEPRGRTDTPQAVPTFIADDDMQAEVPTNPRLKPQPALFIEHDTDNEEWGPPGTTIPPGYLGALSDEDEPGDPAIVPILTEPLDVAEIPLPVPDTTADRRDPRPLVAEIPLPVPNPAADRHDPRPLVAEIPLPVPDTAAHDHALSPQVAEPPAMSMVEQEIDAAAPEPIIESGRDISRPIRRERSGPVQAPLSLYDSEHVTPEVLREFEESQDELAEVLRQLQLADTRDAVIDILTRHMGESHEHVAFFAVKSGRLLPWKTMVRPGRGRQTLPGAPSLSLDRPSTFQDIVGTRLPFRGPITDRLSRDFIATVFGAVADQMLGLPVAVRERVVGVLYGDTSKRRVFVQNLGVLVRAAGGALERILKNQKSH